MPRRPTRAVLSLALALLAAVPAVAQAAPPDNDDFADAQVVRVGDRVTGTLTAATVETDEPATSSASIAHTVWYRLTPTVTEQVRIDTCARNAYSELDVYTGAAVDALTEVAHGQYDCMGGGRAYFTATAGTTYHVRVAGYEWSGDIALTVARPDPPGNDDFADAQTVGLPAHITGSTVDATLEAGEPDPAPTGSGHSVWYRVTATTTHGIMVDVCEDFGANAIVTIYKGTSVGALTDAGVPRTLVDVCGLTRAVVVPTVVGTTYFISVRGNGETADTFTMDVTALSSPPLPDPPLPPPNPQCPFQLAAPGSVTYKGTHSAGGEVCLTVTPDFKGVTWFTLTAPPRDFCGAPFAVERLVPAVGITDRAFSVSTATARVKGTFPYGRGAKGTFQAVRSTANSTCLSRELTWSAVTTATPPWVNPDTTPPRATLSGARIQRPLRDGRVVVRVTCPREACSASASMAVAGVTLKAAARPLRKNRVRTLRLALTAQARRAVRRALRARRSLRARVVVVARDADANATRLSRAVTLRR